MNKEFDIEKFNIINDEENYYFFRVLEDGDIEDLEKGIISIDENNHISKLRTDRERWNERNEEQAKYSEKSKISLEEIFSHIKMHYSLQTNCISLSSNANVVRTYEDMFSTKYVMIKVPKKEMGEKVYNAGQYMLDEVEKRVNETIQSGNISNEILNDIKTINEATDEKVIKELIKTRYKSPVKLNSSKAKIKDGIIYKTPHTRISSYQSLNKKQSLEKNKIIAKLTVLENKKIMNPIIKNSKNNSLLIQTIGSAFSSSEQIYYGDIKGEQVQSISKEIVDMFGLLQQIQDVDKNIVNDLKKEVINFVNSGKNIEQTDLNYDYTVKDNISIEEMYEMTKGKVEYGNANSIIKNMFYLSRGQNNARKIANIIEKIVENNSKYEDAINYIKEKGFVVEPQIITRQNKIGQQLSESVNLNLKENEKQLVEEIRSLSNDEQMQIIENGGFVNTNDIITRCFSKSQEEDQIPRDRYYAEAIISQYDWKSIGIEEFKIAERNELIKRLQEKNCIDIYKDLKESNIPEKEIPTVLLNIATREGIYDEYRNGNLEKLLNEKQDILKGNINIDIIERFLGYNDVENTNIRLKDYQQRANNNINEIFKDKKFAQVILPTGSGKSFVALTQMIKYANEHPEEKMLYMAPQDEIINQIKNYIVKYVHGKKDTVGKTEDEIIAEVFPNIEFTTYPNLISKGGKEIIKKQYGLIIADELHRTGAKEWESSIDKLYENQNENVRVLGITATPVRDVDGRDMAEENARKLGYTDVEIRSRKHIASNMTLENAIRMGYVVNPKIVYCKYDLITSGKLNQLKEKIENIDDESKKTEKIEKYNELRTKINKEIDEEIGEEARKKLEEDARKNLDSGFGKEEIIRKNVKKGGKYIVFIPVTDQEKIEDEDGNRIGKKTGVEKIKAYQNYLTQVFKDTDITPKCNSILGSYNKEKNEQELYEFESRNTDETSFMVVMNKANEGLHIDGIDGIVWFRALDENSRILYLQQLGRTIYALDEDNPIPDDKRPVVIDLANNSLTVNIEKDFQNIKTIDDLESLIIVTEWIEEHGEILPSSKSSNKQEQHYYAILRRIQNKYNKYLNGFENFEELNKNKKEQIQEIIEIGTSIDLWNIELPPIHKTRGIKNVDPFEITGVLKDYVDINDEISGIKSKSSVENFIEKLQKLQEIGVDVSKIVYGDTIQTLVQKSGISEEKIKEIGLEPKDKIGRTKSYITQAYRGKGTNTPPTEEQARILLDMGIDFKKRNRTQKFIEKLQKLQEIGVDISRLKNRDIIQTLAQKSEISEEKIKEIGLEPKDKIGQTMTNISQAYRENGKCIQPTEEQIKILLDMGISLEKQERNVTQEFIEKLKKLKEIGVDISKIVHGDTIQTLAQKSKISEEKIKEIGLELKAKIGNTKTSITLAHRGKGSYVPPTEEQVKILLDMGISLEKQERNATQEFIEKLQKLQEMGVDVSKIVQKDTIQTLVQKSGISEKKIKEIGLEPKDKIGQTKMHITQAYRGKGKSTPPTEEQVKILLDMGINLEKQERNVVQEFIEKLQKLQEIGVDVSKIVNRDTIQTLVQKSEISEERIKEVGLEPKDKIGQTKMNITQAYRGNVQSTPPTEEQVKILLDMGIGLEKKKKTGQDIGKATFDASVEKCNEAQEVLDRLVEKTKEGGIIHGSN